MALLSAGRVYIKFICLSIHTHPIKTTAAGHRCGAPELAGKTRTLERKITKIIAPE